MINNNKNLKLLEDDFIEDLREDLKNIIKTDDVSKAYGLVVLIQKVLDKHKLKLEENFEKLKIFKNVLIKSRFIALPLLKNDEVKKLLKKYFNWQFRLEGYDIFNKFNQKLINIELEEDRDKLKKELQEIFLNNKNIITSDYKNKTIGDWIKDYNSKLGTGKVNNLQKNQYITDLRGGNKINLRNLDKIQLLINFYEGLKYSSFDPDGFEEEIPIKMDGKDYIYKKGFLHPVKDNSEISKKIKDIIDNNRQNFSTDEIKPLEKEEYPLNSLERKAIEEEIKQNFSISKMDVLKKEKDNYPLNSLERRAIEEEIKKLNKDKNEQ